MPALLFQQIVLYLCAGFVEWVLKKSKTQMLCFINAVHTAAFSSDILISFTGQRHTCNVPYYKADRAGLVGKKVHVQFCSTCLGCNPALRADGTCFSQASSHGESRLSLSVST